MNLKGLETRIRRQPPWKQEIIRATLLAIPTVTNEWDRDNTLPGQVELLLGSEKTMRGSTVYSAVEKIQMVLSREASQEAATACRLAEKAMQG